MSSINNQMQGIKECLDPWAAKEGGKAFIAFDFVHAWQIVLNKPGSVRVVILFEDEKARVNFPGGDITGRVNRYFDVIISRGRSLALVRSQNLTDGVGGGSPLYDLAEQMRDRLRTIRFNPNSDEVPDYVGMGRWGNNLNFDLDAYRCSIWVGTQLNMQSTTAQSGQPV